MGQETEYDPNTKAYFNYETKTGADAKTAGAMSEHSSAAGLAARVGEKGTPKDPDDPGEQPAGLSLAEASRWQQAKRQYTANKAAKAKGTPAP